MARGGAKAERRRSLTAASDRGGAAVLARAGLHVREEHIGVRLLNLAAAASLYVALHLAATVPAVHIVVEVRLHGEDDGVLLAHGRPQSTWRNKLARSSVLRPSPSPAPVRAMHWPTRPQHALLPVAGSLASGTCCSGGIAPALARTRTMAARLRTRPRTRCYRRRRRRRVAAHLFRGAWRSWCTCGWRGLSSGLEQHGIVRMAPRRNRYPPPSHPHPDAKECGRHGRPSVLLAGAVATCLRQNRPI